MDRYKSFFRGIAKQYVEGQQRRWGGYQRPPELQRQRQTLQDPIHQQIYLVSGIQLWIIAPIPTPIKMYGNTFLNVPITCSFAY